MSLVKVDVQGHELNVVRGMERIMARSPAIRVFFEYWPTGLSHAGHAPCELPEFFRTRGFALFELAGVGLRPFDERNFMEWSGDRAWQWTNVLATRE